MEDIFHMELDKSETAAPLYQQLADGIARLIADGHLPANSKLPPIRKLADQAGVNPATVVTAYKHLESKQMAYSRIGSGTFVSPLPVEQAPEPVANLNIRPYHSGINLENAINFANTSLPHEMFPVAAFKRAFDEVLEREKGGAFSYMDIMGHEPLRALLCGYLESCGIKTSVENVQIISGAQQGVDLISKAILRFGDVVFVEKPTFYGAAGAFLSRGGKLVEIPLLEDGMDIATLENYLKLYQPKLIYMTAYFQTPTGVSYSLEKKRRLLELAEQYGAEVTGVDDLNQTFELLLSGRIDATLNAEVSYYDYMKAHPDADIRIAVLAPDATQTAIPVPKGETSLISALNDALEELSEDGTLSALSEKYFGTDISRP